MMRKGLIEKLFESASIQRWNDHVRPVELTELDKQAHKTVIAFIIAKLESEDRGVAIDWMKLIEGGLFEFLQRVILTDIKPPVFHKMMAEKGRELNEFVIGKLKDDISDIDEKFAENFRRYLFDPDYSRIEKRIIRAAHYLATQWEFKIIYNASPFIYGIERTKEEIENQIEDHYDLIGVQKIILGKKSFGFVDLCGQLRFQQRWAHTPRIPRTSVLGHLFIVASFAYFCSRQVGACDRRVYNNFYASLFHDLPEVLTRDIISPIKRSVSGLEDVIKQYEKVQIEERILPLLPSFLHNEMKYFTEDEFSNKALDGGVRRNNISCEEMNTKFNNTESNPLDGELIRACDEFAAFIEASLSIKHGVKSPSLEEGKQGLLAKYKAQKVCGVDFGVLFDFFA